MAETREIIEFVDLLTELTQKKKIVWERHIPKNLVTPDTNIDLVYVTEFNGRDIRLYEEGFKNYIDEYEYHWSARVVLEFIDESGNSIWDFPRTNNAWDLLNAVKYMDADVDGYLEDVFKKY